MNEGQVCGYDSISIPEASAASLAVMKWTSLADHSREPIYGRLKVPEILAIQRRTLVGSVLLSADGTS